MQPSIEAIVAIIALLVALPPTIVILIRFYQRYRSHQRVTRQDSIDELDLTPVSRGPFTSSSQPSPQNSHWRTTSIRIVVEASQQDTLFQNYPGSTV
ncbi:hypothetical protein F4678DRAFT_425648 [Xylaria arbuscula]|nr:hypothetical protein F4678DRAFT_425648 [Xylaria arbuscula]